MDTQNRRVGRPKYQWAVKTAEQLWEEIRQQQTAPLNATSFTPILYNRLHTALQNTLSQHITHTL